MRIGFYQFAPAFGAVEANLKAVAAALEGVEADLIVLPELATSGYLFRSREEVAAVAEPVPGRTTEFLHALARRCGAHLVMGLAERAGERFYNSAVAIGPQGLACHYRKVHLFYEEKLYFEPGDLGFSAFEVNGTRVGVLVCFDHMFPEAARTLALQGVQVIAHPSNLVLPGKAQLTTRVRALENGVFWVLCNRFGSEDRGGKALTYTGASQVVGPDGAVLGHAPEAEPQLKIVEVDPAQALDKRVTPHNDLFADRRPEVYRL